MFRQVYVCIPAMSFLSKLRLRPAEPLLLLDPPPALEPVFSEHAIQDSLPAEGVVTQAVLFARDAVTLSRIACALLPRLAPDALLWIAYPKKSGSVSTDLTRDNGWDALAEHDWVGVAQVSLDADWSALRFRARAAIKTYLRATPVAGRQTEGIDYAARTVVLPADAAAALNGHPGLHAYFRSLSFSHQREWAESIAEAKKPETRARRIQKMTEALLARPLLGPAA